MKVIYRIRKVIDAVIPAIASVLFFIGFISAFLGAYTRTFTDSSSFIWVDEVVRITMIWATMLVVGIVMRKGELTAFTLITDMLPHKVNLVFQIIIQLLVMVFYWIIFRYGLRLAMTNANLLCTTINLSMKWVYMIWPISAGFILYEGATRVLEMVLELFGYELPDPDEL